MFFELLLFCFIAVDRKRSQQRKEEKKAADNLLSQSPQTEDEQQQQEADTTACQPKEYVMPADSQLMMYIDDVNELVKNLPSSLEQAVCLAK